MGNWHPYVLFPSNDSLLQIRQLVKDTDEGTWIGVNPNSLLKIQKNQILRLPVTTDAYFTGILPYQKNEYYVATTKGAIKWDRLSKDVYKRQELIGILKMITAVIPAHLNLRRFI